MTVTLSKELEKEISVAIKEHGYDSEKSFIEDALKHKILLLKKDKFLAGTKSIHDALKKKGLSEEDILKDFELSRA